MGEAEKYMNDIYIFFLIYIIYMRKKMKNIDYCTFKEFVFIYWNYYSCICYAQCPHEFNGKIFSRKAWEYFMQASELSWCASSRCVSRLKKSYKWVVFSLMWTGVGSQLWSSGDREIIYFTFPIMSSTTPIQNQIRYPWVCRLSLFYTRNDAACADHLSNSALNFSLHQEL